MMASGQVAARTKAMEARKLAETGRCGFTPAEDSPDVCLQHIQAEGKKQVEALTKDAIDFKFMQAPLTPAQVAELIRIPAP